MLFIARMTVEFSESLSPEEIREYQQREKAYSAALQEKGIMKAIWRVAGQYSNYSIYNVRDHDHLHEIMTGFPMFQYMDIKIEPLSRHPNALHYYFQE
ncbi:muconolactone delta-isomerase [Corynebacterium poyangense]|uniref:Muconolactone Delta-isomerase n=1 Tax=Corynebacterium poyangense TaxID=2684405 RepID=A0A7H0SQK6_9CORY|nr:muconolactone Delta-isomerase family protein [Corynebacterium poyangense]MBZ8178277.1 muconolactone delta-isomerase [Corynebacterium poyangense]QNQ90831.1 muconolactone delta-isomerase [Corynebacterium poyangense]